MALREEKKRATRATISDAAMGLFLAKGFDQVTVAEVATAAQVSVNTAFNYFPTKEDLFFDRQAEVVRRLATAVAGRHPGESAVAAIHRCFLDRLRSNDPTLGLGADVSRFWQIVSDSPALQARLRHIDERTELALADALASATGTGADDPTPRLAAAVLAGVDRALHGEIRRRMLAGQDPDEVRRAIAAAAGLGFGTAASGLGGYATRPHEATA